MTYDEVNKHVAAAHEAQSVAGLTVVLFITDKTIPLEQRWDIFTKSWNILPDLSYGEGHVQVLGEAFTLYNDFGMNRHQQMEYMWMYETIQEWIADDVNDMTQETADLWREAVLGEGYASFTYDW